MGKISPPYTGPNCDRPAHYEWKGKLFDAHGREIIPGEPLPPDGADPDRVMHEPMITEDDLVPPAQKAADDAAAEVAAARIEADGMRATAEGRLRQARASLAALPPPPSASPLADRLGIQGWSLDLAHAALASVAANGLAAFLLAFAAHGWRPNRPRVIDITPEPAAEVANPPPVPGEANASLQPMSPPPRDATAEADAFARSRFRPSKRGRVILKDVPAAYEAWCREQGLTPLPTAEIGAALAGLFSSAGLYRRGEGARAAIPGIEWRRQEPLRIEGP